MFFAIFESVIFANGFSAPQHSTYFCIFELGLLRVGGPGVAKNVCKKKRFIAKKVKIEISSEFYQYPLVIGCVCCLH